MQACHSSGKNSEKVEMALKRCAEAHCSVTIGNVWDAPSVTNVIKVHVTYSE